MCVGHGRQIQRPLQCALPITAAQQVGTAYDVIDAAGRIVDYDGQLIGVKAIAPAHHRITASALMPADGPLQGVDDRINGLQIGAEAQRRGSGFRWACAAGARISTTVVSAPQVTARAAALVSEYAFAQLRERGVVMSQPLALVLHGSVPAESERIEGLQDGRCRSRFHPSAVQVFDAQ